MYVLSVCVPVCVCVSEGMRIPHCVCGGQSTTLNVGQLLLTLKQCVFVLPTVHAPGHIFAQDNWPWVSRDCPVSTSHLSMGALGLQTCATAGGFLLSSGDSNSGFMLMHQSVLYPLSCIFNSCCTSWVQTEFNSLNYIFFLKEGWIQSSCWLFFRFNWNKFFKN